MAIQQAHISAFEEVTGIYLDQAFTPLRGNFQLQESNTDTTTSNNYYNSYYKNTELDSIVVNELGDETLGDLLRSNQKQEQTAYNNNNNSKTKKKHSNQAINNHQKARKINDEDCLCSLILAAARQ